MFLHSLKLQNIRSYSEQTIHFPQGSLLLSGDIGSGKSTLLQSVEFALFGVSRPDLPAEALLKKGATWGSVELEFSLKGTHITIQRKLKKEKEGIKQLPGTITMNNLKKDLMPVELKAEIISLLGYPEEFLTKSKNFLFRYTVYCPQEEMKSILQEDAELRLDTLRKLFNIEKYKVVRENVQIYLKELRTQQAVLQEKTAPLIEKEKLLQNLLEETSALQRHLQMLLPLKKNIQQELLQQQQELQQLERQQQQRQHLQQQFQTINALLKEKQAQLQWTQEKRQELEKEIQQFALSLPQNSLKEELAAQIICHEQKKKEFLTKKTLLMQHLAFLHKKNRELVIERERLEQRLSALPEKKQVLVLLNKELLQKTPTEAKKKQLEELFLKIATIISRNETLLQQAQQLQQKMSLLTECPTCLQEVLPEHKERILEREQQKIMQAQQLLADSQQNKAEILQQKAEIEQAVQQLLQKEHLWNKLSIEIVHLEEKETRIKEVEKEFQEMQERAAEYAQEMDSLQEGALLEMENKLEEFRTQMQMHLLKEQKERLRGDIHQNILQLQRNVEDLFLQQKEIGHMLLALPEMQENIMLLRTRNQQLAEQEKEILLKEREVTVHLLEREKQVQDLSTRIAHLQEERKLLHRTQKSYQWLEQFFMPLTGTIEKHIMLSIHRHFNNLFQEWFSLLMDNEQLTAHVDEAFTPIIQQDGHEIFFEHLSGGERTSAALAYRLALNRVINEMIQDIQTKELFILDEPTDGFSSEQLDRVRDVLKKLQVQQLIIVSHESKIESFVQHVIRVQKEGNESRVIRAIVSGD